ncbi:MAG: HEAT repeat domain-containing protein [Candidatus Omnitrophica bacterium]|nr:HEAT repeat domain-containing protein [Candidatus Omnitrophota bacterium]
MRKRNIIISIFMILAVTVFYLGLPLSISFYRAIFDPMASLKIEKEFRKLSSDVLIRKLHPIHPFSATPLYAIEILAERQDTKAVPDLVKSINSWNPDRRYQAIRALGLIGDKRAVEPLLKIVNDGELKGKKYYRSALLSLCQIGYEPMRPVVLERLKRPDGARNGSAKMMEYIGKKDNIPLLEGMLSKISGDDVNARLDRGSIKRAIEAIKKREGIQ